VPARLGQTFLSSSTSSLPGVVYRKPRSGAFNRPAIMFELVGFSAVTVPGRGRPNRALGVTRSLLVLLPGPDPLRRVAMPGILPPRPVGI